MLEGQQAFTGGMEVRRRAGEIAQIRARTITVAEVEGDRLAHKIIVDQLNAKVG